MEQFRVGQVVEIGGDEAFRGTIRWLGTGEFAPGNWIGLELEDPAGKNDGEVKGKRYFRCRPGHGMMIRPENIKAIAEQSAPEPVSKPGIATKRTSILGASGNGSKPARTLAGPKTGQLLESLLPSLPGQCRMLINPKPAAGARPGSDVGSPSPIPLCAPERRGVWVWPERAAGLFSL